MDVTFRPGRIADVVWKPLKRYEDQRGWLVELFRSDELPVGMLPTMAYVSQTEPGIARGPHEHVDQADYFCFLGPGDFKLYLWDNRPLGGTYRARETHVVGAANPMAVLVPPGVVHAYQCVGPVPGVVLNCPNRLYKGPGRKEPVDEIRHEEDPKTPYHLD